MVWYRSVGWDCTHITLKSPLIPLGELMLVGFFVASDGKIICVSAASFSTSNFVGSANSYANQMQEQTLESSSVTAQCPTQTLPARPKTQRPRVPPPSKVSVSDNVSVCICVPNSYRAGNSSGHLYRPIILCRRQFENSSDINGSVSLFFQLGQTDFYWE
jgi:hypothetical protein